MIDRARIARVAGLALAALGLSACLGTPGVEQRLRQANDLASTHGFRLHTLVTDGLPVRIMYRPMAGDHGKRRTAHVYIEGDGLAWTTRYRPSANPTPLQALGLRLALRDKSGAVAYLGRPCQYVDTGAYPECRAHHWTQGRYSPRVLHAMGKALDQAKHSLDTSGSIGLVGYSGGGVVAALLAAERPDVAWLVTVAANLDHRAWTRHHGDSPLSGSLNPAETRGRLDSLPQVHLVGGRDTTVPASVVDSYIRSGKGRRGTRISYPDHSHHCCWQDDWHQTLADVLARLPK